MSASEVAFFSLTKPEIDHLKESENKADNLVAELMEQPRYLLSTILISNNLVNIGVVILSYFITKQMLNFSELSLLGWKVPGYALEFIFNVVVVTFVLVLFGEATPKVYATHHKFSITRLMAPVFSVMLKVYQPMNWLLIGSTQVLEKKLKKHNAEIDIEEINKAIEITVENENSNESKEDARILKGVVQFGNITVKQIMRPRMEIVALDDELKFDELIEHVKEKGYSRMPVYKESIDNIVGILYIKDLLEHLHQNSDFHWQKLLREPFFVPETKRIDDLLRDFQKSRKHLAVVVDEFGGTKGIVTLEDIVEEVVGDIKDEFDEAEPESCVRKISDNLFVADGKCLVSELTTTLDLPETFFDEVKGDSETLGGLVLELMGKIPEPGEVCHHEFLQFTVSKVEQNRISEVKILLN
jgi:gliding motility-associated protein GldE